MVSSQHDLVHSVSTAAWAFLLGLLPHAAKQRAAAKRSVKDNFFIFFIFLEFDIRLFGTKLIYFPHYTINTIIFYLCGMRLLFIIALSICALVIDYQIYKIISRRWIRQFFLCYAVIVDILIFAVIFLCFRWPFYGIHAVSPVPLWLAWFFFLNTIPKCAYTLLHLVSHITEKIVGKWVRLLGILFALYAVFVLVKGAFYNIKNFDIKHITFESPKIPPHFNGYRIALFSDVHLGNLSWQDSFLHTFVAQVKQLQPDIIFHTGDIVNMYAAEITPAVQAILSRLQAPDGVYGVLGNHDMGPYFRKRIIKTGLTPACNTDLLLLKYESMKWKVLHNESIHIGRNGDSIGLCGVPYPPWPPRFPDSLTNFNAHLATHLLDTSRFNIMLCHTPRIWETMQDNPELKWIDLILTGHTHAMQAKINIGRWKWSPARLMYKYWSGLYEHNGRYLYVNEGLGYVLFPMRIGTKPEITLITLSSK